MPDSVRIKIYGQLCWFFASTRDKLDSARMYADSIDHIAQRLGEARAIAYAHFYYGIIQRHEGNLAASLDHFERYVQYQREKGDNTLIATGQYQVGTILSNMGNYEEAMKAYHEVLKIHEEHGYHYGVGFTLNAIGGIQRTIKNYEDATDTYRRAIGIFEELEAFADMSMSIENLGNVFAETGQFDSALACYKRALAIDARLEKKYGIASELQNLGNLYYTYDSLDKALDYQLQSLQMRRSLPQKRELAISLMNVGKVYIRKADYNKAHSHLQESLAIAQQIGARPVIMDLYEQFATLYETREDFYTANWYLRQYGLLKDSIFNENRVNQIIELETRYKTAEKDQQILLLSKENEIKEAKAKQQTVLRNSLTGLLVVILAFSGYVFYSMRQKIRNQRIISQKNEEIKVTKYQQAMAALEMKALRAQMNPHFIFNCMNSINRMILSGENEDASKYLNKFSKLIRLTLENSEKSMISLEDELALVEAYIQLESIRFKGKINYKIDVDSAVDPASTNLPSMVLQPFIENSIWHGLMHKSEPGNILIQVRMEEELLTCTIEDDGVGREMAPRLSYQSQKGRSMGLKITEERLRLISRNHLHEYIQIIDLKDASNNALGTRVHIRIPLN